MAWLQVAVVKPLEPFLPRQMGGPQQPLLAGDLALLQLLLAKGVEELGRAPAFGLRAASQVVV